MSKFVALLALASTALAQSWVPQTSGTNASFRGIHAVDAKTVWVSGTAGTYVTTTDGGTTWHAAQVPGAEKLDFRACWAFDANTAYLLSIGTGEQSRIYQTTDAGAHWKLLFTNPDAKGFFDGIAFWDHTHGIVVGDVVDGRTTIFTTDDGGATWKRQTSPEAIGNEGAFAASNSNFSLLGEHEVWLGTTAARVLHSSDNGRTWTFAPTPIRHDGPGAGIFSVKFVDAQHGIAVGGDYSKPTESRENIAVTTDGGKTWTAPSTPGPAGFRSAITRLGSTRTWVVTGPSGSDSSTDDGATWKQFDSTGYNALEFVSATSGWAVGPRGRIAAFKP
ncbi:MAG TPA: YCF48-related protein [Bryobacteraceae bacterium]|nr:YCF48-related protein [Bryobacteraceae bacterium]